MKKIFLITLLISLKSFSMTIEDCRSHYLSLIKNNEELQDLYGGEQVQFFLHPEVVIKNYKSLQADTKLLTCIKNNNH